MIKTIAFILVLLCSSFAYSESLVTPSSSSLSINGANAKEDVNINGYSFFAANLYGDTITGGASPYVSYQNSTFNFGRTDAVVTLPPEVMSFFKYTYEDATGASAVPVALWGEVIGTGGTPNHSVAILGQANAPNGTVGGEFFGVEGKGYSYKAGAGNNAIGVYGISVLANLSSNAGSVAYGFRAQAEEINALGTGTCIGGSFSGAGGGVNHDIFLASSGSIAALVPIVLNTDEVQTAKDLTVGGIIDLDNGTFNCTLTVEEDAGPCTGGSILDVGSTSQLCVVCN